MLLVGYTDSYPTKSGYVGGLIIKNSWWDGVPLEGMVCTDPTAPCAAGRGSHSLDYLMGRISDRDERQVCPNVHSPASWYPCGSLATCSDDATRISAKAMRKVLELQCLDRSPYLRGLCTAGERFFLKSLSSFGGGLTVACLLRADAKGEVCTPPIWVEDLALLLTPVDAEVRPNDMDACGFYVLPYDVYNEVVATLGGTYALDLDLRWTKSSFAGAPASERLAGKDYQMLQKDTLTQTVTRFRSPMPDLTR